MGYVIFRGISTDTTATISSSICSGKLTGVVASKMPSHKKASMRMTKYYVKGRDGALHVDEGFENFDLTVTLVLIDGSAAKRQIVNAWADGTGKLITSDDLTLAYKASVKDEIVWNRVRGNSGYYDTATIIFNCEPCMVEAVDSEEEMFQTGTLNNPGTATAFPLIKVEGVGDVSFSVNGENIEIDGMTSGVPVFIDCQNGYVYTASGAATMRGNIPELQLGENAITFGNNLTKLTITPHWRWV